MEAPVDVLPYLPAAATIAFVQKWLKTTHAYRTFVQAFPGSEKYAHWCVAGVLSLIAAAGIHYSFMGNLDSGGKIVIDVPSLAAMGHGLIDWYKAYILQHFIYAATSHAPPPGAPPPQP